MTEQTSLGNMDKVRHDTLQTLMDELFSVMKQIHQGALLQDPSLSPPQARLLFTIANRKEPGISVKELAEKTSVTPGAITQFVDILVKKDLVKRYEDPNDRRSIRLTLTENAKNKFEKLRKNFLLSATRAFNTLNNDEIDQLIKLLAKVSSYSNLRQGDGLDTTEKKM
ncbi:MAG: MarR family transcriptional regulator [Chloroflexi bacterium]|nr:MarR family transcriptional regulator [Chloroflexota bacterium]